MSVALPDIDAFYPEVLKSLTLGLLEENARLTAENEHLRDEVARLQGLKGKPAIKPSVPSGMEPATEKASRQGQREKRRRGVKRPTVSVEEQVIAAVDVPAGSQFKGYEDFTVQDLKIEPRVVCYRRERWLTPEGETVVAPLPGGISDHFGPELKRFILSQYHQGQTTVPRLVDFLQMLGVDISKRQVVRLLTAGQDLFVSEAQDVLRAGLEHGSWISVDDTGARHQGKNGVCTQIGNDAFTFFATTGSKSRSNFLELLRAGYPDHVLNDDAFAYMRERHLAQYIIDRLAAHPARQFADTEAWKAHLDGLGISELKVSPNPVTIATEGSLWGAVISHGFLKNTVILSDDAGQFNVGTHALCWVHAERLVHKLDAFTAAARTAKDTVRSQIWSFYADLKAYRAAPEPRCKADLETQFERIFQTKTGFATLDRLLARLYANREELLRVLDHPDIPLHTNGSENDIRCQVIRRKISGTTRSDGGRQGRDTFLGLAKTCFKLDVPFWEYLGSRLGAAVKAITPPLPELVKARCRA